MTQFSIGQVAARAGLAASAIRYYERAGLLPEPDRAGGRRVYSEEAVERLAVIQVAKDVGFTLAEIRVLLQGVDREGVYAEELRQMAHRKLPEVDALLKQARVMQRVLRAAEHCECLTLKQCVGGLKRAGLLVAAT